MTDATLGFIIDSSQAAPAAAALDKLTASATSAQNAAAKLGPASSAANAALNDSKSAADNAAHGHANFSTQAMAAQHSIRGLTEMLIQGVPPQRAFAMEANNLTYAMTHPGGLLGALKEGVSAFKGFLSPTTLVIGGLVAAAAAVYEYFDNFSAAAYANDALNKELDILKQIKEGFGDLTNGAKEFQRSLGPTLTFQAHFNLDKVKAGLDDALKNAVASSGLTAVSAGDGLKGMIELLGLASDTTGQSMQIMIQDRIKPFQDAIDKYKEGALTAAQLSNELAKIGDSNADKRVKDVADALISSLAPAVSYEGKIKAITSALNGMSDSLSDSQKALKNANFSAATAGLSAYGREIATINQALSDNLKKATTFDDVQNYFKTAQSATNALNTKTLMQRSQFSFSVAQAPQQYQSTLLASAGRYGIDPNLLAAITQTESHFNPYAVSNKGALGMTQIMPSTARALGVDPSALLGNATLDLDTAAKLIAQLSTQFHGDPALIAAAYNGGPKAANALAQGNFAAVPKETLDYVAKITQAMPDAKGQADAWREWQKQVADGTASLKIQQGVFGTSFQAMDKATIAQKLLTEQVSKGAPITDATRAAINSLAGSLADLQQKSKVAQAVTDLGFQRSQLGRTQDEQQVYADLRARGIDINTPNGQMIAAFDRSNNAMLQLKTTSQDVLKGIVDGFRQGQSAAEVFSGALDKIASKLEDKVLDSLLSGLLGGQSSGGGIFGSLFSSLLGGGASAPLSLSAGSIGGTSGILAALHHTGYGPGDPMSLRYVHSAYFDDAPRFHIGIGPGERAAIIRDDEGVFTPGQMRALAPVNANPAIHFAPVYNIDARGSQMSEAQFRAILDQNNKNLLKTVKDQSPQMQRSYNQLRG